MEIFKAAYKIKRKGSNLIYQGFDLRHLSDVTQYYVHPHNQSLNSKTMLCQSIGEAITLFTQLGSGETIKKGSEIELLNDGETILLNIRAPENWQGDVLDEGVAEYNVIAGSDTLRIGAYTKVREFIKGDISQIRTLYKLLPLFTALLVRDMLNNEKFRTSLLAHIENPTVETFVTLHEDFYQNHKYDDFDLFYEDVPGLSAMTGDFFPFSRAGISAILLDTKRVHKELPGGKRGTLDPWTEQFEQDAGIKNGIILYGNTQDLVRNKYSGIYDDVSAFVADSLKHRGFGRIITWDRLSGIDMRGTFDDTLPDSSETFDLNDMEDFFPYILHFFMTGPHSLAVIINFGDFLINKNNILLAGQLTKLMVKANRYSDLLTFLKPGNKTHSGNIIVVICNKLEQIPALVYSQNPYVSILNVPLPGRMEREKFIESSGGSFNLAQDILADSVLKDDFVDALDGLSLVEITQLINLSKQIKGKPLSGEKLIHLHKYGKKTGTWETLSAEKLKTISAALRVRVKGQDEAIAKVRDSIVRAYTGFSGITHSAAAKKPRGVLFFVGPTGVGKTELAKSLAEFLYGDENACIRFDMSEYNHEFSDIRLVGAPPGYTGYEEGGQLTNAVREKPFSVLLFDEIEKANSKILDKFLQILEDGRLTDGHGNTVSFADTVIIFTSNIGSAEIAPGSSKEEAHKKFLLAVQNYFTKTLMRPELLNRIGDNIVPFNFIDDPLVYTQIVEQKFDVLEQFIMEKYNVTVQLDDPKTLFLAIGSLAGVQNGGRGLLNIMETKLVNPLSAFIFAETESLSPGKTIRIQVLDKKTAVFDFEII